MKYQHKPKLDAVLNLSPDGFHPVKHLNFCSNIHTIESDFGINSI